MIPTDFASPIAHTIARGALAFVVALLGAASPLMAEASKHPRPALGWRGVGNGTYHTAAPIRWAEDSEAVLWKTPVGKAHSSPVITAKHVLVTSEPDQLVCLDKATGRVLWKASHGLENLPPQERPEKWRMRDKGCGFATPTPTTDGAFVYVAFGTGVVACYRMDGQRVWIRFLLQRAGPLYGRSASPLLIAGKLVVHPRDLIALDPATGKTLWSNPDARPGYGSPIAARIGETQIAVTPMGDFVRISDGKILYANLAVSRFSSPIYEKGVVYFINKDSIALKLPPKYILGEEPEELWLQELEGEFYASPLFHNGRIYTLSVAARLIAINADDGDIVLNQKLDLPADADSPHKAPGRGASGPNIYPSPTRAGKHIYVGNDAGETHVLAAADASKSVSQNKLPAGSGACLVFEPNRLYTRVGDRLYCISAGPLRAP